MRTEMLGWILLGLLVFVIGLYLLQSGQVSRLRRRRRKNQGRIISTSKEPTVKLSAKSPKKD